MKPIARLLWSYFGPTPALRIVWLIGVVLLVASLVVLSRPSADGTHGAAALWLPMVAIGSLYVSAGLMPLQFGRLARAHVLGVLPFGRLRLLASLFIAIAGLSLLAPMLWAYSEWSRVSQLDLVLDPTRIAEYRRYFLESFLMLACTGMLMAGWLYLAVWFMTSERNATGFAKGVAVLLLAIYGPTRAITTLEASLPWNLGLLAMVWTAFAGAFLLWPRLRQWRARRDVPAGKSAMQAPARAIAGREIDLILGTARPWLLAAGMLMPALLAAQIGYYSAAVWLYYLTIFSTISGANAGQAAGRSRALWLRSGCSRRELFDRVERSFWRHNAFVLAVLTAALTGIGVFARLPLMLILNGVALLALGVSLSTYLGLMVTRGLRWQEGVLGAAVMIALMSIAVFTAEATKYLWVAPLLEATLAVLAIVLRFVARGRWERIDWTQCRPDRAGVGRFA